MKSFFFVSLFATFILFSLVKTQAAIDALACNCERNGNTYTVSPADSCTSFTISAPGHAARTLSCPAGLRFDTKHCVCDYPSSTVCPDDCQTRNQPTPSAAPARLSCTNDIGPVFERFNASLAAGRCLEAADTALSFDINCERTNDRLDDNLATAAFYITYLSTGCPVRNITLPSLPPVCEGVVDCSTLNPENDFTAGCGVNDCSLLPLWLYNVLWPFDYLKGYHEWYQITTRRAGVCQIRFSSMSCYARYAAAGCELAAVTLNRLSKVLARQCKRSCALLPSDTRAKDLATLLAGAGRCDLAQTVLWDDVSECDDSSDQAGAYVTMADYYIFFFNLLKNCPPLTLSQNTEPSCSPIIDCFASEPDGRVICGNNNINVSNGVDCLAVKARNGCEAAPIFSRRYVAHTRRVCPDVSTTASYPDPVAVE